MRSSSLVRRLLAPAGIVLSLLLLPTAGSAEPGPYPGLPQVPDAGPPFPPTIGTEGDRNVGSWLNTSYAGMTGSARAEQWVRLPTRTLAANIALTSCAGPGLEQPCPFPMTDNTVQVNAFDVAAFLVSPAGSDVPYGEGPVIPVRTVAFGSIPVEVEIQLAQARGDDGLPRPMVARLQERNLTSPTPGQDDIYLTDAGALRGPVELRVRGLRVDGTDVGLETCRTPTFELSVSSEEASGPVGNIYGWGDPDTSTFGFDGGGFNGTADIPALAGCRTASGDDLSAVLTSVLSGPDNPVSLRYGALASCPGGTEGMGPVAPGADLTTEAGCYDYDPSGGNPVWNSIPLPREYPTYAPGDAAGQ